MAAQSIIKNIGIGAGYITLGIGYSIFAAYLQSKTTRRLVDNIQSKEKDTLNNQKYETMVVISKNTWLCPYVKTSVIAFKEKMLTSIETSTILKSLSTATESTLKEELLEQIRNSKTESEMKKIASDILLGKVSAEDLLIDYLNNNDKDRRLNNTRTWILPSLLPGEYSLAIYSRKNDKWDLREFGRNITIDYNN